jgi:AcrR family transcriptional regulator
LISQIAKHAGLSSTGMISYHFAGKDDLLTACVAEIEKVTDAFMQARIAAADGDPRQRAHRRVRGRGGRPRSAACSACGCWSPSLPESLPS